ncbi:MAG: zf-HC2 domain-containing protein [Candidatus Tectomicrobia bacterium]|nr:zf-HC2 domain-containing protein [Candidatus Tectomicrobia bacterium]
MQCHDLNRYLYVFLDGELDAKTNADIHSHLEECLTCGKRFEFFSQVRATLRTMETKHQAPAELNQRIGLELHKLASRWTLHWQVVAPLAVAAVLAVLAVLGVGVWRLDRLPAGSMLSALLPRLLELQESHATQRHELGFRSGDFWKVDEWLNERLGFSVVVPRASLAGYILDGASVVNLDGRVAALVEYHEGDDRLGYLAFRDSNMVLDLPRRHEVDSLTIRHGPYQDHHVAAWTAAGKVHVLISNQTEEELLRYAELCVALTEPGATTQRGLKP